MSNNLKYTFSADFITSLDPGTLFQTNSRATSKSKTIRIFEIWFKSYGNVNPT